MTANDPGQNAGRRTSDGCMCEGIVKRGIRSEWESRIVRRKCRSVTLTLFIKDIEYHCPFGAEVGVAYLIEKVEIRETSAEHEMV